MISHSLTFSGLKTHVSSLKERADTTNMTDNKGLKKVVHADNYDYSHDSKTQFLF